MQGSSQVHRIDSLTSLRFFAALYVMVFHFVPLWFPSSVAQEGLLRSVVQSGYVGVSFFYLLSGYVLTFGYRSGILEQRVTALQFWRRRFYRLFPVLLLSLCLGFPPLLAGLQKEGAGALATALAYLSLNATFLGAWFPSSLRINYPVWSISVEAFFYLLFPLAIVLLRNWKWPRSGFWAMWILGNAIVILPGLLLPVILEGRGDDPGVWMAGAGFTALKSFLEVNPLVHLPTFLAGIFLRIAHEAEGRKRFSAPGFIGVTLLTGAALAFSSKLPFILLHNALLLPLFAGVILYAIEWQPLRRLLSKGWLILLGESSFALYLIHVPARDWLSFLWNRFSLMSQPLFPLLASVAMVAVVVASVGIFLLLEKPIMQWAKSREGPRLR